jgi:hypothetical protein
MALPAPNDPVTICNLALSYLAEDFVSNIEEPPEGDDTAALCKLHYPKVRRALLRGHSWNFAIDRATLAADGTAPAFGFSTKYKLPANFLRYLSKHDELGGRSALDPVEGVDYQMENGFILTGSGSTDGALRMRYIYDNEDVSSWDALFVDLMSVNLALSLARNFKSAPRSIQDLKDTQRELKAEAKAVDGQERPPIRIQHSKFNAARTNRSSNVAGRFTRFD